MCTRFITHFMSNLRKSSDPLDHLVVEVVSEVVVIASGVPRPKRVEANRVKSLLRQRRLIMQEHLVQVLVVSPRHEDVIEAAVSLVHAVLGVVGRIIQLLVIDEAPIAIDDGFLRRASDGKRVAHNGPLGLVVKRHHLTEVVDQARQVEPIVIGVNFPDSFRRLIRVNDVGQVKIRIRFVREAVEHVQGLHDGGLEVIELKPLLMLTSNEIDGLLRMHFMVSSFDSGHERVRVVVVGPEVRRRLLLGPNGLRRVQQVSNRRKLNIKSH